MNDILIRLNKLGFQVEIHWGPNSKYVEVWKPGYFHRYTELGKTPEIALDKAVKMLVKKKLISHEEIMQAL